LNRLELCITFTFCYSIVISKNKKTKKKHQESCNNGGVEGDCFFDV